MLHPVPVELFKRVEIVSFDARGFDPEKKNVTSANRSKIRCPVCRWQPTRSSRWFCLAMGAPEHFDGGCGTQWNTFETAGRCPGCGYQWLHTSCLRCGSTSRHEDWYEKNAE